MAGKPPQGNPQPSASGKRPAISIDANFDEPSRAKVARTMAAADRRGELPTTRSNIIVWSVVGLVLGLPVIAVIWLVAMPDNPKNRYPVERVIEARGEMGLIGTRAKKVFETNPQTIPTGPTLETFGLTEQDLGGQFDIGYTMNYADGILTVFASDMFADSPRELIMLANLRTGEISYNREPER